MSTGRESIIAAIQAAVWGTAVEAGAGAGQLITNWGINRTRDRMPDDSSGQDFIQVDDAGPINVAGNISGYVRYYGFDFILAMIMGAAAAAAQQGATAAYSHALTLAGDVYGLFATLAAYDGTKVREVESAKFNSLEIRGQAGQPLEFTLGVIGNEQNYNTTSGTNTTTTIANVTIPDRRNRILFRQLALRINDASGAGLASPTDVFKISAFALRVNRPQDTDRVNGSDEIIEPVDSDFPEIMLDLTFPEWNSTVAALVDAQLAETPQKADLVATGGLIEDTYYNSLTFEWPNLIPQAHAGLEVAKAAKIGPVTLTFRCAEAASAPTGMAGLTLPLRATIVNERATDILN